jgi:hypothetical protein
MVEAGMKAAGAENRGTASDQGVQGERTDLADTVHAQAA